MLNEPAEHSEAGIKCWIFLWFKFFKLS
jgi:hypothetical protein